MCSRKIEKYKCSRVVLISLADYLWPQKTSGIKSEAAHGEKNGKEERWEKWSRGARDGILRMSLDNKARSSRCKKRAVLRRSFSPKFSGFQIFLLFLLAFIWVARKKSIFFGLKFLLRCWWWCTLKLMDFYDLYNW